MLPDDIEKMLPDLRGCQIKCETHTTCPLLVVSFAVRIVTTLAHRVAGKCLLLVLLPNPTMQISI